MRALGINIWHDGAAKASVHSGLPWGLPWGLTWGLTWLRSSGKATAALLRALRRRRKDATPMRFVVGGLTKEGSRKPIVSGLLPWVFRLGRPGNADQPRPHAVLDGLARAAQRPRKLKSEEGPALRSDARRLGAIPPRSVHRPPRRALPGRPCRRDS